MVYTQKQIYDYLLANPIGAPVEVGDVDDLNGSDYIFFNYLYDTLIGSDDKGVYRSNINITVFSRDFENMKRQVDYIKDFFNVSVSYSHSNEYEYFTAICECGVLIHG